MVQTQGKRSSLFGLFAEKARPSYLKAAETVGSTKKYNVLHLSSKHLVVCCNQDSKSVSLLFLQTTFFVADIWSGKTFFCNHCNKLHLLAAVGKIQNNSANQDYFSSAIMTGI